MPGRPLAMPSRARRAPPRCLRAVTLVDSTAPHLPPHTLRHWWARRPPSYSPERCVAACARPCATRSGPPPPPPPTALPFVHPTTLGPRRHRAACLPARGLPSPAPPRHPARAHAYLSAPTRCLTILPRSAATAALARDTTDPFASDASATPDPLMSRAPLLLTYRLPKTFTPRCHRAALARDTTDPFASDATARPPVTE
jgi:hypothetical protein